MGVTVYRALPIYVTFRFFIISFYLSIISLLILELDSKVFLDPLTCSTRETKELTVVGPM